MEKPRKFQTAKTDIIALLKTAKGDWLNIAYYVYQMIRSVPGLEPELLRFVLEKFDEIDSNGEKQLEKVFTEKDEDDYEDTYGKIVDGILEALLKKRLDSETFYQELWKGIQETPILKTEKEKAFAFYYIWIDVKIPYFELEPGIEMDNDEYNAIQKEILQEVKRARFILHVPAKQKTERTSRLVHMLDQFKDERKKAVFMAQIFNIFGQSVTDDFISELAERGILPKDTEEAD